MIFIVRFLDVLITILYFAIIARAIISWFPVSPSNVIVALIYQITEPILAPLRRIIPRVGMIDITPLVALIVLAVIQNLISQLVYLL